MSNKKEVYTIDKNGNITNNNINYDIARFTFISKGESKTNFESMIKKVNEILFKVIGKKSYEIDFQNLEKEYIRGGIGDVPHFVHQYMWSRYRFPEPIHDVETAEAMYFDGVNHINEKIEKNLLPKDLSEKENYL